MQEIKITRNPPREELEKMGVKDWPMWGEKESEFPWHYDQQETCYIVEGEVEVTPDGGEPVVIKAGDLVTFPRGMSCTWKINRAVSKHYRME